VNERISDLLDRASDDGGAPLGFSGSALVQKARAERRRRRTVGGVAVGLAAAGVAGVLAATQLLASPHASTLGPSDHTSTPETPSVPSHSSGPTLTRREQSVVDQCARTHLPAPPGRVPSGQEGIRGPSVGDKVTDSTSAGPRATFLRHWTLDAHLEDDLGLTATFVNPSHTRWASCDLAAGETRDGDGVWTAPLPQGPVPQSWYGPDGFRHQGNTVSWSEVCAPGEGQTCARELFAGALVRYDGVESARVAAPDGTTVTPVFGTYTYVFRHAEQRVDPHRAANDTQPLPSMPVTLLDGNGHTIIRYDYFPSYLLPSTCPPTGGC
jgi:hypothetical protein